MEPGELRIGNYYNSAKFNIPVKCEMADLWEIYARAEGATPDKSHIAEIFEPIPLTDWSIKLGFEQNERRDTDSPCVLWKVDGGWMYLNIMFFTDEKGKPSGGYWIILENYDNSGNLVGSINLGKDYYHIHELQNVYRDLSDKELVINEPCIIGMKL